MKESIMQVKIGPSFFKNEKRDYRDWEWAFIREAAQNGMDAPGSRNLRFELNSVGDDTVVVFENDGAPMSEDVLVNKLMALGETGKGFEGTVGGFGKAKILLYMMNKSYTIRTGTILVEGAGGDYEITRDLEFFPGTRSEVVVAGVVDFGSVVRRFAAFSQWSGTMWLGGVKLGGGLKKGARRRELDNIGVVYTNRSFNNMLVARVNGIPMFTRWVDSDRCVVLELSGPSCEVLSSNRDSLKYPYNSVVDEFVSDLSTNKRRALAPSEPSVVLWDGANLVGGVSREEIGVSLGAPGGSPVVSFNLPGVTAAKGGVQASGEVGGSGEGVRGFSRGVGFKFWVKNYTGLKVPEYYLPEGFSSYSRKLVHVWAKLLVQLHRLEKAESEFSVGFMFDEDAEAQYDRNDSGVVYYLNPSVLVESGGSRAFRKRFKLTERNRLLSIAVHEFVHDSVDCHNEAYANRLTDVFARVMDARREFNWCFA